MIRALRYELFGQRQQFEPREQHRPRGREQKHIHLHLHLHLGLGARTRQFSQPSVARVTRMFAAFMGALSMALTLNDQVSVRDIPTQMPLFNLASNLILGGALFALVIVLLGGIPLVISAWRSTPRSRFLLLVPLLTFGLVILYYILYFIFFSFVQQMTHGALNLGHTFKNFVDALPFYGFPIISTIALNRVMRRATLPDAWLHFADRLSRLVVLGILLMFTGVLLWGFALAFFAPGWFAVLLPVLDFPWNSWLLIFLGTLIAVMVALFALFSQTPFAQPSPHDALPYDWAPFDERGDDPVDPTRENACARLREPR